jgi:GT2 family glycosyltransferase
MTTATPEPVELSVVIVNYETFALTLRCLESVFAHTHGVRYEVILVDNCSRDRDPGGFVALLPAVRLVRSSANVGFAAGCNLGLREARGAVILLLNSDVILTEDAVGDCYRRLISDGSIDVVSPRLVFPDGRTQYSCRALPSVALKVLELLRVHKLLSARHRGRLLSGTYFSHAEEAEVDAVWGAFFMFKRRALAAFPEAELPATFFMYGEDMEWCLLLRRAGFRILFFPNAVATHLVSASSGMNDQDPLKLARIAENRRVLLRKHYGRFYAALYEAIDRAARIVG